MKHQELVDLFRAGAITKEEYHEELSKLEPEVSVEEKIQALLLEIEQLKNK